MEWVLVSPQIHSTFGSLGFYEGDVYHINDNCLRTLEEIYYKLQHEDRNLRTFRRAVGFGQNIKKDLVPILVHVRNNPKIIEMTVKILVNLTIPVECLLCIDSMSKNNVGRHTIFELNNLLMTSKEAFMDSRVTKSVLDYTNDILESNKKMTVPNIENVNNSLLLLRNILHIPEIKIVATTKTKQSASSQNQIIWNLFTQSIDKTLLHLITSTHGTYWCVTLVQLIALIYKDQHIGTLQKLLHLWFEASISESSEDNESNTSPPNRDRDDSSPMLTSDPTSDSSDNGGRRKSSNDSIASQSKSESNQQQEAEDCNYVCKNHASEETEVKRKSSNQTKGSSQKKQATSKSSEKSESPKSDSVSQPKMVSHSKHNEVADKIDTGPSDVPKDTKNPEMITSNSTIINNILTGMRGPTTPLSNLTCSGPNSGSSKECISTNSEFSDCGYVTQLESKASISTSSNEEEELRRKQLNPKSHHSSKLRINIKKRPMKSPQDRKEKRRKKLIERGKTNIINMKGLMLHVPTDEDITNVLKEFTVDFLLKGYGNLIQNLHSQLIYNVHLQIDTSHFFWLLTYFLKFASQLELDLNHMKSVLKFDILSYLTHEGVNLCEEIQLTSKVGNSDMKACLRRIHLVITAIREFIQTIDVYKKFTHLSDDDRMHLVQLQIRIGSTEDLRCLFVLLLRHYQPDIHSKQYLQDLIVTNHVLLIFLDNAVNRPNNGKNYLIEHLQQFATVEVMHQYGLLLQDFKTNGEYINDCIFTMMHHVGGDLGYTDILFQPNILKVFLTIWETGFEICQDWRDLVDYVINTFMRNPRSAADTKTERYAQNYFEKTKCPQEASSSEKAESWTEEEKESLQWNYMQSANSPNVIEKICFLYREEGLNKSHNSVVKQLLEQKIIREEEYQKLLLCSGSKKGLQEYFNCKVPDSKDDIQILKDDLEKQNMGKSLIWLQRLLLETCFIKICLHNKSTHTNVDMNDIVPTMEPIPFHNIIMNKSVPVVPWNNEQSTAIHNQTFLILLHRLGFHLPADSGKLFVRIPNFWSPDVLFDIARKLGSIDESHLKFSAKEVSQNYGPSPTEIPSTEMPSSENETEMPTTSANANESVFCIQHIKKISSIVQVTELTSSMVIRQTQISTIEEKSDNWLDIIVRNKRHSGLSFASTIPEQTRYNQDNDMGPPMYTSHHINLATEPSQIHITTPEDSICETASMTSDLTRMYVSDEDEKHESLIL